MGVTREELSIKKQKAAVTWEEEKRAFRSPEENPLFVAIGILCPTSLWKESGLNQASRLNFVAVPDMAPSLSHQIPFARASFNHYALHLLRHYQLPDCFSGKSNWVFTLLKTGHKI